MSTHKIIVAGFGGQGVMLIGQMFAYAAMTEGKEVTWMPAYGPEMRGGTANCTVIISDKKIASPIVTEATVVAAMNEPSLVKFQKYVAPGKHLFINSSLITREPDRTDVNVHKVDCIGIADELQNMKVSNMAMLGAINSVINAVSLDSIRKAMEKSFSSQKAELIDLNMQAVRFWGKN
jgi:2-oxoglutarate ferredoxin oxidoreductase subunit gamma